MRSHVRPVYYAPPTQFGGLFNSVAHFGSFGLIKKKKKKPALVDPPVAPLPDPTIASTPAPQDGAPASLLSNPVVIVGGAVLGTLLLSRLLSGGRD